MLIQDNIEITSTSAWRNATPLIRFGLLNIYQSTITRIAGQVIHLICKLQILALYLKVTLESFSSTNNGVSQVARYFTDTFLFVDFFDIQGQSSTTRVVFFLISGYYLLLVLIVGALFYKALRKGKISGRVQNFWAFWIYLHPLIILLPTFTFHSAILGEILNNNLNEQSMIVLSVLVFGCTAAYLGSAEIFLGSSMKSSNYLFARNNLIQRFEAIEKCCLSVILYVISDPETKYWIAICLNFVIALLKIPYILRNLPYYERSVLNQEILIDSLTATLATLNLLAKVVGPSDYTNPLSIIITWVLLSLLAAKISLSRLHKLLANLMNARPEEVRFSHLPKKLHLYEDYLRRRNHVNLDAQSFDYYNLVLLGREKSISTTEEGKTDKFDFKNQEHFKTYSLNFLKENMEKSSSLKITYIRNLIKHKFYAQAVYALEQASKTKLDLARELSLNYLKVELETMLTSKYKKIKKDNLNLLRYIEMNCVYKDLTQLVLTQIKTQMSFWDAYILPKVNFNTLVTISNKVENKKKEMKKFWRKYQLTAEETFIAPYLIYSLYMEIVNCLPAQSFDILTWYFRRVLSQEKDYDKDELKNETLYGNQNVSVEISGSKENMGAVLHCSPSITNVLGYDAKTVLGSQVSLLLPNCLKEHHNGFLLRHYETGKKKFLDKTQKTFAQTSDGYILPIFLHVRLNPFLGNNISYMSIIRPRKDKKNYLIVLPDGTIDGATQEIVQELEIPTNYKISIFDICPRFAIIHGVSNRIGAGAALATIGEMKAVGFGQTIQNVRKRKTHFSTFKEPNTSYLRQSRAGTSGKTTLDSFSHLKSEKNMKEDSALQTFMDKDIEGYSGLITSENIEEVYKHYKEEGEELTFKNYQTRSRSVRSFFTSKENISEGPQSTKAKVHVENMNYGSNWVRIVRIENFARLKSMYSLTKTSLGKTEEDLSEDHFSEVFEIAPTNPLPKSEYHHQETSSIALISSKGRVIATQDNSKILPELAQVVSKRGLSGKVNPKSDEQSKFNFEGELSKRSILKKTTHQTSRGLDTIDSLNNQLTQRKITFKPELVSPRDSEWRALNNEPDEKEDPVEIIKIKAAQKSEKVKNEKFKSIHEAASYYGSSQGRNRLSRHRAYENALEIKYRSSKITFFIISFIVSMIAVVGILIAQMITADQVYQDVSKKHNVLHYNDKRTDALISTDYLVRTWQGVNKGMLGIMPPNSTLDPILDDLESSILSSVNILQGYGHDLLSDMSIIEIIFQEEFFIKNIKMYQLDDQGSPTYYELDDTFTGIAKVASHALELIVGSGSDTDTQNTVAADFVLFNSLNDLINQCNQATTIILDDVNYGVGKYKDSVWTRTAIIIVIIVMFLLISVSIIIKINNSVYVFSDFFFKVSNHDATLANESLKNFHKVLSVEHQEEDLIASVQQIEQGWGQVKPNDQMKVTPKTIQFTNYKIANAFQILRLWPLVFCMLALISVFTVKQLAGVNSIGSMVSHIIASLTNTLNQNLMASLITEIVVSNASTMVKNKPILTIFDTVIDTFAESNSLITAFMDADGKISDSYNELLFNVSCEAPFPYSVTTFPSNISLFREACYNLTNGLGSIGTIELNNMIYQDSNNYISNFMASPRTFQDQTEFFMKRDEVFSNLFTVAREINVQFWQTACDDFWGFLAVESDHVLGLGAAVLASIITISVLAFPVSLLQLSEKDYEMKRMIKLVPIPIILKNRWLKTYLTKTSRRALDAINKVA